MNRRFQSPIALRAAVFLFPLLLTTSACMGQSHADGASPQEPYSFFVAGHIYGNGVHADTSLGMYPPFKKALLGMQEDDDLVLGVLTGDFVFGPHPERYDRLEADLKELDFPVRMVPGNHDSEWWKGSVRAGEFEARFGERYGSMRHRRSLFLFFDTNMHHWRIKGRQEAMLRRELADLEGIDQLFVFVHNILWWDPDSTQVHHAALPNSSWNRYPDVRFWEDVVPLFKAVGKPVWVFAGDTGVECNGREISYWREGQLHLVASGMGCDGGSAYLRVRVGEGVEVEVMGLAGAKMGPLEDWGYWPTEKLEKRED